MELGLEVLVMCGFESFVFFCQPMLATSLFRNLLTLVRALGLLGTLGEGF